MGPYINVCEKLATVNFERRKININYTLFCIDFAEVSKDHTSRLNTRLTSCYTLLHRVISLTFTSNFCWFQRCNTGSPGNEQVNCRPSLLWLLQICKLTSNIFSQSDLFTSSFRRVFVLECKIFCILFALVNFICYNCPATD